MCLHSSLTPITYKGSEEKYEAPYTSTVFTYRNVVEADSSAEFRCHAFFDAKSDEAVSEPASVNVMSKLLLLQLTL